MAARTFALWDFVSEINAVVLFVTDGGNASFAVLQRTNGRRFDLPAEPKVSPDRARHRHRRLLRVELRQRARRVARDEGRRPKGTLMEAARGVGRRRRHVERREHGRHRIHARGRSRARRSSAASTIRPGGGTTRSERPADGRGSDARPVPRPTAGALASCCGRAGCRPRSSARSTRCCRGSGLPFALVAARLRPAFRPARADDPRDRLRHGRDDCGDRARHGRTTTSSASKSTVPASAAC